MPSGSAALRSGGVVAGGDAGVLSPRRLLRRAAHSPLLVLAPILLALGVFYLGPILFGVWASFQADGTSMDGGRFAGLSHYRSLLQDPRFHASMIVTIGFTFGTVVVTYLVGLGFALALHAGFAGSRLVGGALLIPWTTPLVVVAVLWGWLLDYQFGAVNYILLLLGVVDRPVGFLVNPDMALWSVGLAQVWRLFPLAMVMLLAALKAIPRELYEAAQVDGASTLQQFRNVTLPGLRSTTTALLLLMGIWAFGKAFTIIFVMTGGGPAGATETLVVQTYLEAFRYFRMERASALGTMVLALCAVFTWFYLRARRG
jgi:multiple sugar transport system permease protein